MKRILFCLGLVAVIASAGIAQSKEERAKRSDEVLAKTRRIDLLAQILPLVLSKDQINLLLPALEKVRANVDKVQLNEYEQMIKVEKELDVAIKAGQEKGEVPSKEFEGRLQKMFGDLDAARRQVIAKNLAIVQSAFDSTLNAGQRKAAANTIDARFFDPSLKPEDLTDARKLEVYIKVVILDPQTYDVLLQLAKRAT